MDLIILGNSKEIKGVIRAVERGAIERIKHYAISDMITTEDSYNIRLTPTDCPMMSDKLEWGLNDLYNSYFKYNWSIEYKFIDMSCPYNFDSYELDDYLEYLQLLLDIMQKAEKYQQYLDIIKENMIRSW